MPSTASPSTTADAAAPPSDDVHDTAYAVMAAPLSAAAYHPTTMPWSRGRTIARETFSGTIVGITGSDSGDASPSSMMFVAYTRHVYETPYCNPSISIGDAGPLLATPMPPPTGSHVTVYCEI